MQKTLLIAGVLAMSLLPLASSAEETDTSVKANVQVKTRAELEARKKAEEKTRSNGSTTTKQDDDSDDDKGRKSGNDSIRDQMEAKREALKTAVEERRDTAINKIKDRIADFTDKVIKRFEAALERLEKLATRIESRIAKMEAEGIDVVEAKELLLAAEAKIEIAKTSVAEISLPLQDVISDTGTTTAAIKGKYESLRAEIVKAKEDIKAAHAALVEVILNLKPGFNKIRAGANATSAATTTIDNDN